MKSPLGKTCGIYAIHQRDQMYIGQSQRIGQRINDHFLELKKGLHSNPRLQALYDKYGRESFWYEVLEECEIEQLDVREQWWLDNTPSEVKLNIHQKVGQVPAWRGVTQERYLYLSERVKIGQRLAAEKESSGLTPRQRAAITREQRKGEPGYYGVGRKNNPRTVTEKLQEAWRQRSANNVGAKYYAVLCVSKEQVFCVQNLDRWCKENMLNPRKMRETLTGVRTSHRDHKLLAKSEIPFTEEQLQAYISPALP